MFVEQSVQTNTQENIEFRFTVPLWEEVTAAMKGQ